MIWNVWIGKISGNFRRTSGKNGTFPVFTVKSCKLVNFLSNRYTEIIHSHWLTWFAQTNTCLCLILFVQWMEKVWLNVPQRKTGKVHYWTRGCRIHRGTMIILKQCQRVWYVTNNVRIHVNFLRWSSGRFFFKKREILAFAINKEESFDIKKREISLISENTPYFKKNLWKYDCRKWESPA
jgi:hypothetical protein